ncbi:PrpF family protein [Sphingomonas sp. TF3]|nr:PrpF family protein [Sphingomonas sp. TF3]
MAIPAVYMRGGTSRALMFHARDLPGTIEDRPGWDAIFAAALGSPDPRERQLDGLGGGISSLSKVAVLAPSAHPHADVDYLFGQVSVQGTTVSYRGNCGNISAAVGPFAVDEGLVALSGDEALIRIHHVTSGKIIHAHFPLAGGKAAVRGNLAIQGVAGTGASIRLDFLEPGGAATGRLLPTGRPVDTLDVPDVGLVEVSLVDAANPVVFVRAEAFGLAGDETPAALGAHPDRLARFDALRQAAAVAMGIVNTLEEARVKVPNLPLVALVSAVEGEGADIRVRMISAGQPHRATPLTGAMCLAVAARLPGTLVAAIVGVAAGEVLQIAHASGVLPVDADVCDGVARAVTVYRTARRLMEGRVLIPA